MTLLTLPLNSSFLIILIGAIFIYFGKIIGDTKVEKYDRLSYYIEGLIFSSVFVFLPFIFAWYLFSKNVILHSFTHILFLQLFILGCLYWNLQAHHLLRRYDLLGEFKKRLRKEFEKLKNENSIKGRIARKEKRFKQKFGIDFVELSILGLYSIPIKFFGNRLLLIFFSFITIWGTLSLINAEIIQIAISLFFSFIILTMIALAYGFGIAYYPFVRIYLKNNKIIEGKILKFGDFVYILKENRKLFVNSSEIVLLEESLFKGRKP